MPLHGQEETPYFPEGTPLRTRLAATISVLIYSGIVYGFIFLVLLNKNTFMPYIHAFNQWWIGGLKHWL